MDHAFEEMHLGYEECHDSKMSNHDRCLCEDCLIQNFSYFGHQDVVLEKRPKRKSVTSVDDAFGGVFKGSRIDTRTNTPSWCPTFGSWSGVPTLPNMYNELRRRYEQGEVKFYLIYRNERHTYILFLGAERVILLNNSKQACLAAALFCLRSHVHFCFTGRAPIDSLVLLWLRSESYLSG